MMNDHTPASAYPARYVKTALDHALDALKCSQEALTFGHPKEHAETVSTCSCLMGQAWQRNAWAIQKARG